MTAISTQELSKYYGSLAAVDKLNLEIPENMVFGFLGPNGAGKTTTVKLLTGFAHPTSGQAFVAGEAVGLNSRASAKIGFLPDVPAFYDWMTGQEFLKYAGELHHLTSKENARRSRELLKLVSLEKAGKRRIGGYSRGMRQRLGIAQALINRPSVIFMDEPTSALDPLGRREILELITRLRESTTVFMSTHILSDVERVCDIVGIINKGKLVTVSSVAALQQKYARSSFEIEFIEKPDSFIQQLKEISWLADPQLVIENGVPKVTVKAVDINYARKELPKLIGESGLTLTRYELGLPNLEDIFVEIMKNGDQP